MAFFKSKMMFAEVLSNFAVCLHSGLFLPQDMNDMTSLRLLMDL